MEYIIMVGVAILLIGLANILKCETVKMLYRRIKQLEQLNSTTNKMYIKSLDTIIELRKRLGEDK